MATAAAAVAKAGHGFVRQRQQVQHDGKRKDFVRSSTARATQRARIGFA